LCSTAQQPRRSAREPEILVIGATSAIAEATERLLAGRGDALYLVARNEQMLAAIAADLTVRGSPRIATESLDANDPSAHEAMLERAEGFLGGIDIALLATGPCPIRRGARPRWN